MTAPERAPLGAALALLLALVSLTGSLSPVLMATSVALLGLWIGIGWIMNSMTMLALGLSTKGQDRGWIIVSSVIGILAGIVLSLIPFIGWLFSVIAAVTWLFLAITSVRAGVTVNRGEPHQYRFNTHLYDTFAARNS